MATGYTFLFFFVTVTSNALTHKYWEYCPLKLLCLCLISLRELPRASTYHSGCNHQKTLRRLRQPGNYKNYGFYRTQDVYTYRAIGSHSLETDGYFRYTIYT